jgi:hypothetical protein
VENSPLITEDAGGISKRGSKLEGATNFRRRLLGQISASGSIIMS